MSVAVTSTSPGGAVPRLERLSRGIGGWLLDLQVDDAGDGWPGLETTTIVRCSVSEIRPVTGRSR